MGAQIKLTCENT